MTTTETFDPAVSTIVRFTVTPDVSATFSTGWENERGYVRYSIDATSANEQVDTSVFLPRTDDIQQLVEDSHQIIRTLAAIPIDENDDRIVEEFLSSRSTTPAARAKISKRRK